MLAAEPTNHLRIVADKIVSVESTPIHAYIYGILIRLAYLLKKICNNNKPVLMFQTQFYIQPDRTKPASAVP